MKNEYDTFFDLAIKDIKATRSPQAQILAVEDYRDVVNHSLLSFAREGYDDYSYIVQSSVSTTISCFRDIVQHLFEKYDYIVKEVTFDNWNIFSTQVFFAIKDCRSNVLYVFKDIEKSPFWPNGNPEEIENEMAKCGATECKYIYLMTDYAYLQVKGHNDDIMDPGRGHNIYSFRWFLEELFGEEEYKLFIESYDKYVETIKGALGYTIVKTLSPEADVNFRKIVETEILAKDYSYLLDNNVENQYGKQFRLPEEDFNKIKSKYLDKKSYLIMLGNSDFSESLITAEWLYRTMKTAKAIDLTVVGTGFFKAIEQLLYALICLHKNEERKIKAERSNNYLELNDRNIDNKSIDVTLGSMATFYKANTDLFDSELSTYGKNYVKESLFAYSRMRNGYFHKDNIHLWETIDNIRNTTLSLIFLLLGAHVLSEEDMANLGHDHVTQSDDYYKLCEYVNYHRGDIMLLVANDDSKAMVFACPDFNRKVSKNKLTYSGVYFRPFMSSGYRDMKLFKQEDIQFDIYLCSLKYPNSKVAQAKARVVKPIYKDGIFVGPSIAEEEGFDF